eukprot:1923712-Prymnesium_polylepis.1
MASMAITIDLPSPVASCATKPLGLNSFFFFLAASSGGGSRSASMQAGGEDGDPRSDGGATHKVGGWAVER